VKKFKESARCAEPTVHFLQSENWQKFQQSLGRQVATGQGDGWQFLAIWQTTPFGGYWYLPYGPSITDERAFAVALAELRKLAAGKKATFIRIEPTDGVTMEQLRAAGFRKVTEVNPEHTWTLDLTKPEAEILAGMKQNNRNLYHNYAKKGVTIKQTTDPKKISYLTQLMRDVAKNNHIATHDESYLKKQMEQGIAKLYYTEYGGAVIVASLIYDYAGTRYYAYAAADYEHRKLSIGTAIVAQMIVDAKRAGLKQFDFYGVTTSQDPKHPWQGLTKFKMSFGGQRRDYLGTWDLPLNRFQYGVFRQMRWLNRTIRKLVKRF
jgi:lipid II:glycine glycyltransferase (peptidoglycan interpeptide bridge formation enzyme)